MRFRALSVAAVVSCAAAVIAPPAVAQYDPYPPVRERYGPREYYDPRPYQPRPYPPRRWDDERYERRQRPVFYGDFCVTSRGNCRSRPQPSESSCECYIPGFGPKRGAILARPVY